MRRETHQAPNESVHPGLLAQMKELYDITDMYPYMEPDAKSSLEQPNNSPNKPAAQKTIFVITQNLIAMTITDINSCAALECSTERIRGRSRNFRNALLNLYVAIHKLDINSVLFFPWRLTHLLLTLAYLNTRPLLLISVMFFLYRLDSFHPLLSFLSFFRTIQLQCIYIE